MAKEMGVSQGSMNAYLRGKALPGCTTLRRILLRKGININWLLTGDGEKFVSPELRANHQRLVTIVGPGSEKLPSTVLQDAQNQKLEEAKRFYHYLRSGLNIVVSPQDDILLRQAVRDDPELLWIDITAKKREVIHHLVGKIGGALKMKPARRVADREMDVKLEMTRQYVHGRWPIVVIRDADLLAPAVYVDLREIRERYLTHSRTPESTLLPQLNVLLVGDVKALRRKVRHYREVAKRTTFFDDVATKFPSQFYIAFNGV